ncbi:MAG: sigma-54 dependent transcriptional regulator [Chloroflexota bacterium]
MKDIAQKHLLVVDDEKENRDLLVAIFAEEGGYKITEAKNGTEALAQVTRLKDELDVVLMDVKMPDTDGISVLKELQDNKINVPIILMTAFSTSNLAIKAMQMGAADYITKPFDIDDLKLKVERLFERKRLEAEVAELRTRFTGFEPGEKIIGNSPKMHEIYKLIGQVSSSDATVLITGETGTGKELIADIIHSSSKYSHGPLIKVNCAALPETLLESELFGHEAGAFTGAVKQRKGRFEMAHKGTIFLDEVGEMSKATQKKLLRVLQEREFERVGGSLPVKVDVRVISATNRNLQREVDDEEFRSDLYFRLNVISIHMPTLLERKEDIPLLVEYFLDKHRYSQSSPPARISKEAMEVLMRYNWPGNVRELKHAIERAVIYSRGGVITTQNLMLSPRSAASTTFYVDKLVQAKTPLEQVVHDLERAMIVEALRHADNDEGIAAETLGLSVKLLKEKIGNYQLE